MFRTTPFPKAESNVVGTVLVSNILKVARTDGEETEISIAYKEAVKGIRNEACGEREQVLLVKGRTFEGAGKWLAALQQAMATHQTAVRRAAKEPGPEMPTNDGKWNQWDFGDKKALQSPVFVEKVRCDAGEAPDVHAVSPNLELIVYCCYRICAAQRGSPKTQRASDGTSWCP